MLYCINWFTMGGRSLRNFLISTLFLSFTHPLNLFFSFVLCVRCPMWNKHFSPISTKIMNNFFPFRPYSKAEDPTNVVSKYQLAARYGRQSNANCGVQYDGCMLNLLDIIQALVNAFIR